MEYGLKMNVPYKLIHDGSNISALLHYYNLGAEIKRWCQQPTENRGESYIITQ